MESVQLASLLLRWQRERWTEREMVAAFPSCHASDAPSQSDCGRSAIDCLTRVQNTKYTLTMTSDPLPAIKLNVFFRCEAVERGSLYPLVSPQSSVVWD